MKKLLALSLALLLALSLFGCTVTNSNDPADDNGVSQDEKEPEKTPVDDFSDIMVDPEPKDLPDNVDNQDDVDDTQKDKDDAQEPTTKEPELTMGQKNALGSAKSYLAYSSFSYKSLIGQLEYEKYTLEDATYAADNCGADWKEQALKSAESYLDYSAFSYEGLIDQLEYEEFTSEEAKYGVDNCGADWNEQAAKSAEAYLEYMSFSRSGLIEQLEYEGFTHEQAVYGAEANGY